MKKKIMLPVFITMWTIGLVIMIYVLEQTITVDYLSQEEGLRIIYGGIIIIAMGTGIMSIVLNTVINQISLPIKSITKEAKRFAKGEYEHSVRNCSIEEIQQLGNAFDHMGEKMYRTIRKLHYQKTKAESILSTLQEGIVILDEDGYISEVNEFAKQILGAIDLQGKKYHINDLLRDVKSKNMFQKAQSSNQYTDCEVVFEDKVLYMGTMPIQKEIKLFGYILVIRDTTEIRNLEQMRYEFVSNVTHEIKTPLTSIQGFVETLKDGAIENPAIATRFLDIIDIEAKRLYRLIQDILVLSEIENMENNYEETAGVAEVIESVINLVKPQAEQKQITLETKEIENIVLKNVNKDHIKQLVLNLVSNAIRYTDQGGVTVAVYQEEKECVIEVSDTGIGIPKESITRIFERFYRVDKGRSRKNGGTGLGLSIVKHLVQLYGGKIEVESEENKGSIFRVKLKIT
ncbi:MAG: ATP-binding protein [Cellulosilyticaceae bacterium]